jgi:hypothetical protein
MRRDSGQTTDLEDQVDICQQLTGQEKKKRGGRVSLPTESVDQSVDQIAEVQDVSLGEMVGKHTDRVTEKGSGPLDSFWPG